MTGRRKSGRKAKKDEKPRKSRRRGRHGSDSEESGSDLSGDENTEISTELNNEKGEKSRRNDAGSSNDASKGDESGGSDGAWQVRSSNGSKAGNLKLKLCLQRPPDVPSPTSESLPSPRPRRSKRGAIDSPSKTEDASGSATDDNPQIEDDKREDEKAKKVHKKEKKTQGPEDTIGGNKSVKSQEMDSHVHEIYENESSENREIDRLQKEEAERVARQKAAEDEEEKLALLEEQKIKEAIEKEQEEIKKEREEAEMQILAAAEQQKKLLEEEKKQKENNVEEEKLKHEKAAPVKGLQLEKERFSLQHAESERMKLENVEQEQTEKREDAEVEIVHRQIRSPSRDSSVERAKEEALSSRIPKKAGSEEGEVFESPERDSSFPSRVRSRIRTTGSSVTKAECKESIENQDEVSAPLIRKRRWGSSGNRSSGKDAVLISTDILKEIIPEAKPVTLNEVQLSPNRDEELEDGETGDDNNKRREGVSDSGRRSSWDDKSRFATASHKRRDIPSDESEKDYEEEGVESGGEEMLIKQQLKDQIMAPIDESSVDRKASVLPPDHLADSLKKQRSPSPARNTPSTILFITNLVRPFTVPQLRDLLARTGTIGEDGFWIDKIKSQCFVKYSTEEEATFTRNALHGIRWPASNPKELSVDYGTEDNLKKALVDGKPPLSISELGRLGKRPLHDERRERVRERDRELERDRDIKKERGRDREIEKKKSLLDIKFDEPRDRKPRVDDSREDRKERIVRKVTIPVREWDMGKKERGFSPPPLEASRRFDIRDKDFDLEGRRRKDRGKGRNSFSPEPARKVKRKDEDLPHLKLHLDDLFRKTKTSPSVYWLPLTASQIAVKEEMRRKHMAEHEKKIAEQKRKSESRRKRPRSNSRTRSRSPKK